MSKTVIKLDVNADLSQDLNPSISKKWMNCPIKKGSVDLPYALKPRTADESIRFLPTHANRAHHENTAGRKVA